MFEKDIVEGIGILNKHNLGWAHRINVDDLDMSRWSSGLLGLIYKDDEKTHYRVLEDYRESKTFCGFSIQDAEVRDPRYGVLTREWQRIIRYIQENIPADEPFEATLGSLREREG